MTTKTSDSTKRRPAAKVEREITVHLDKLIENSGISMRKVSRDIDMTPATLSRIKTGKQTPDLATIKKLCDYFNCELTDLVRLE